MERVSVADWVPGVGERNSTPSQQLAQVLAAAGVKLEGGSVPWPWPSSSTRAMLKAVELVAAVRVVSDCWILYQAIMGSPARVWPRARVPLLAGRRFRPVPVRVT